MECDLGGSEGNESNEIIERWFGMIKCVKIWLILGGKIWPHVDESPVLACKIYEWDIWIWIVELVRLKECELAK